MPPAWRLLIQGPLPAPSALAIDEAIALCCARDGGRSTLRFYQWDGPAISLGRFQAVDGALRQPVRAGAIESPAAPALVRRITGGRAVWHQHELTYSIVSPLPSPHFPPTLHGAVAVIAAGLAGGLASLGLPVSTRPAPSPPPHDGTGRRIAGEPSPFCFATAAWYEILGGGKKLIGSAQRRWRDRFLQQGSILLDYEPDTVCRWLRVDPADAAAAAGLRALLSEPVDPRRLASVLAQGLAEAWGIEWREEPLTDEERELADRLVREKYGSPDWTFQFGGRCSSPPEAPHRRTDYGPGSRAKSTLGF
ncbi:MAG: biotin/lipoate A/B protein ligase family protein [Nitrospirota bacterium]